jgi:hypothetical protein
MAHCFCCSFLGLLHMEIMQVRFANLHAHADGASADLERPLYSEVHSSANAAALRSHPLTQIDTCPA